MLKSMTDTLYTKNKQTGKKQIIKQRELTMKEWGFSFFTDSEHEAFNASYSMGGMSINIKDSEVTGVANTANTNHDTTEVLVTFAF